MAKNNYLFRFFLCLIASLCIGIGGVVVGSGYWRPGDKESEFGRPENGIIGIESECDSIPSLNSSETRWSRKISPLVAEPIRLAKSPFSAFYQPIYSLVPAHKAFMSASQFSIRYAPVEMTNVCRGKGDVTSLDANLIRDDIRQIYSAEIGVREKTGKNDGDRVEEYLAITNLGKGYAWCAAFVSWVFSEAGFPEPRTPWSPALFPKKKGDLGARKRNPAS